MADNSKTPPPAYSDVMASEVADGIPPEADKKEQAPISPAKNTEENGTVVGVHVGDFGLAQTHRRMPVVMGFERLVFS